MLDDGGSLVLVLVLLGFTSQPQLLLGLVSDSPGGRQTQTLSDTQTEQQLMMFPPVLPPSLAPLARLSPHVVAVADVSSPGGGAGFAGRASSGGRGVGAGGPGTLPL